MLEAGHDEHDPHEQRQEQRQGHTSGCGHLQERNDSRHVAEIDERKQAHQERGPAKTVTAHGLHDDSVFDELNNAFGKVANTLRSNLVVFVASQQKDQRANNGCGNSN